MIVNPKEKTIKVIRSFCIEGEPVPVGEVLTLPHGLACELIGSNKAVSFTATQKELPLAEPKIEETSKRENRRGKS